MLDHDQSMINALHIVYPLVFLLLCWWHVLHAWQQHFSITVYPELWDKLKAWIRVTDINTFNSIKAEIFALAPQSFSEYLETYWLTDSFLPMWSASYCTQCSIFQDINMNMITEAYHYVLKTKFLCGKRNRRIDHLIYVLVEELLPYYITKHKQQDFGFEGLSIEVQKHKDIISE